MKKSLFLVALLSSIHNVAAVLCQLKLQLDEKPEDTAFEVRGPLPSVNLISKVDYGTYEKQYSVKVLKEFDLEEGKSYYFLLTDYGKDGIEGGGFQLRAEFPTGPIILEEGDGEIGAGKAFTFVVPVAPSEEINESET